MKCDEARPACQRCVSTDRRCPGYDDDSLPVVLDPRVDRPTTRATRRILPRSPSVNVFESEQEFGAFNFFRDTTSPQISGFNPRIFWNRLVLQAAHEDAGVRHALIALASTHECFGQKVKPRLEIEEFILGQYNQAINHHVRAFTQSGNPANADAYLVSCILFICIEVILLA